MDYTAALKEVIKKSHALSEQEETPLSEIISRVLDEYELSQELRPIIFTLLTAHPTSTLFWAENKKRLPRERQGEVKFCIIFPCDQTITYMTLGGEHTFSHKDAGLWETEDLAQEFLRLNSIALDGDVYPVEDFRAQPDTWEF